MSSPASPIVHAVGGSLGSALALLLFYPLERARIELQSRASQYPKNDSKTSQQVKVLLNSVEVEVDLETPQQPTKARVGPSSEDLVGDTISTSSTWTQVHQEESQLTPEQQANVNGSGDTSQSSDTESHPGDVVGHDQVEAVQVATLKSRSRINSEIIQCLVDLHTRGALYKGIAPVITTTFASQFIFFFINAYVKKLIQKTAFFDSRKGGWASSSVLSLTASCIAGVGNVLLTNPLWVTNMAIVTGEAKSSSLIRELRLILRARGYRYLWNGTAASILLVSNPVIQFVSYEQLKNARFAHGMMGRANMESTRTLPPLEAFLAGAIAKTISTIATYPLQLTQTLLRLENHGYHGIVDCLIKLYRRAGYQEWYTGIKAKLLQTVLNASFMFLTYEQIVRAVQLALVRSSGLPEYVSP